MKALRLLFFISMSVVLPMWAMECETDPKTDEMVDAHKGFVVFARMTARLDEVGERTSFNIFPLRIQINGLVETDKLNSKEKYISLGLYKLIQEQMKLVETEAGMKHIVNDVLPIKKVKKEALCDGEFDFDWKNLRRLLVFKPAMYEGDTDSDTDSDQYADSYDGTLVRQHLKKWLRGAAKQCDILDFDIDAVESQVDRLKGRVISQQLYEEICSKVFERGLAVLGVKPTICSEEYGEPDDEVFDLDCFHLIV